MSLQYAKDQPAGFNNRIDKIAIVGAGGTIGSYFTKYLVAANKHTITALTRANSTTKLPPTIHRVEIDYANDATLVSALKGQDLLIITLPATPTSPQLQLQLIRAAAAAAVPYIMPNAYGPDPANESMTTEQGIASAFVPARAEIERLGVSQWLVLATGFWYEWSLCGRGGAHRFGCDVQGRTMTFFDGGEEKITTATWEQCGRAVAALAALKRLPEDETDDGDDAVVVLARWAGRAPVYLSSFRVSQQEMFASVLRATGTREEEWTVVREDARERVRLAGEALKRGEFQPAFTRRMYSRIFYPTGEGDHTRLGLANEALGLPVEDMDEATKEGLRLVELGVLDYE